MNLLKCFSGFHRRIVRLKINATVQFQFKKYTIRKLFKSILPNQSQKDIGWNVAEPMWSKIRRLAIVWIFF